MHWPFLQTWPTSAVHSFTSAKGHECEAYDNQAGKAGDNSESL